MLTNAKNDRSECKASIVIMAYNQKIKTFEDTLVFLR